MSDMTAVREFIVDRFLFGEGNRLRNDTSFLNEGILDSTGILELVTFLERTYSVAVDDDDLVPENLDSLNNISQFVAAKRAAAPGTAD